MSIKRPKIVPPLKSQETPPVYGQVQTERITFIIDPDHQTALRQVSATLEDSTGTTNQSWCCRQARLAEALESVRG